MTEAAFVDLYKKKMQFMNHCKYTPEILSIVLNFVITHLYCRAQ